MAWQVTPGDIWTMVPRRMWQEYVNSVRRSLAGAGALEGMVRVQLHDVMRAFVVAQYPITKDEFEDLVLMGLRASLKREYQEGDI